MCSVCKLVWVTKCVDVVIYFLTLSTRPSTRYTFRHNQTPFHPPVCAAPIPHWPGGWLPTH